MSIADHTPEHGIKITPPPSRSKTATRVGLTVAGATGAIFAGVQTVRNVYPENMFHFGIATASAGLLYFGLEGTIDRTPDPLDNRRTPRAIAGCAVVIGSLFMLAGVRQGNDDNESISSVESTLALPEDVATVPATTADSPEVIVVNNPEVSINLPPGQCGIVAPIPTSSNEEVVQDVKILQGWLNSAGYDAGPVDGEAPAEGQTSQAVDRLQIDANIDPARPWDQLTCAATPLWDSAA